MYCIDSSLETEYPIMLLNQPIGYDPSDPGGYIDGALFQKELMELDNMGKKAICVHINSVGGNVVDGYNICSAILNTKTPVDTYCVGIAASMAGAIFMCGRKRIMMDYGTLMVHNPYGSSDRKQLDALKNSLITMIAAKCSLSNDQVAYLMDRETWIGPAECLEKGFCTEIQVTSKANQKRMPIEAGIRAMWNEANLVYNNILSNNNNSKTMDTPLLKAQGMSLIAAFLDLNTDASDTSILTEVKLRINKEILARSAAEDALAEAKANFEKAQASYEEMKKKYDKMCHEKAEAEAAQAKAKAEAEAVAAKAKADADAAIAKAEAEAKAVAAKTMVESFVGKRIKADAVSDWVATAMTLGVDKVKALIEGLPLNATAVPAVPADNKTPGVVRDPNKEAASAMEYSARIQANLKNKKKIA